MSIYSKTNLSTCLSTPWQTSFHVYLLLETLLYISIYSMTKLSSYLSNLRQIYLLHDKPLSISIFSMTNLSLYLSTLWQTSLYIYLLYEKPLPISIYSMTNLSISICSMTNLSLYLSTLRQTSLNIYLLYGKPLSISIYSTTNLFPRLSTPWLLPEPAESSEVFHKHWNSFPQTRYKWMKQIIPCTWKRLKTETNIKKAETNQIWCNSANSSTFLEIPQKSDFEEFPLFF